MTTQVNPRRSLLVLLLSIVLALIAAPASATAGRYGWPLSPRPEVTRSFDAPTVRWNPGHRGVDLSARAQQPVLAAGDGVVAFAGKVGGKPVVSIDHGGLRTTYEPVIATVIQGQSVSRGEPIGRVAPGHAGCAVETCVHWGAKRGEEYVDPLSLLRPRQIRLLPL